MRRIRKRPLPKTSRTITPLPYISEIDLSWLAGILEGEACFDTKKAPANGKRYPRISIKMTDEDIIKKVSFMFSSKYHKKIMEKQKDFYLVEILGGKCILMMRKLLPLMGQRRSEKINSILLSLDDKYLEKMEYCGRLQETENGMTVEDVKAQIDCVESER